MIRSPSGRLARGLGWLLTPFVVWAAAFLGAWGGAALGALALTDAALASAVLMGAAGAVAGGLAAFGWVRFMRRPKAKPDDSLFSR